LPVVSRTFTRTHATAVVGLGVFVFAWLFRFNDPGGSFAGLTDDHFFYLVRGWQILFGDLPVRDFVDHGAPLYYYVGAAVQLLLGRGTLSEVLFSVTVLAAGAAATFLLAARASGSILAGLAGTAFQVLLAPRFYNYPKILAYAAAIPALWAFADRPTPWRRFGVAAITAAAFLLRHDHGVFVAAAMSTLLLVADRPPRERIRHLLVYSALVVALLAPYFLFVQLNGGLPLYFRQAAAWAAKDRDRAPVVWPGLFDSPDGVSPAARSAPAPLRTVAVIRDNQTAWFYYLELALPLLALGVLAISRDAFRPAWPRARMKLAMVAVLGIVLNAGFLRSPLAARLADPSVPHAILIAWLAATLPRLLRRRESFRPALAPAVVPIAAAAWLLALPFAVVLAAGLTNDLPRRLEKAALTERPGKALERVGTVSRQLQQDWRLVTWIARADRPDLIDLALYLNACTAPADRILVQPYIPQVLALARRAFAGGHADLRPGFFRSEEAQLLTLERLRRQSVPVILLETGAAYGNFRKSFPLVSDYIDREYRLVGTHVFDERFGVTLFARRDRPPSGTYEPLGWPCFAAGQVGL